MADDDDWETDPDFKNDLTEAEQRAFGNRETMERYNELMDKSGNSVVGASRQVGPSKTELTAELIDAAQGELDVPLKANTPAPLSAAPPMCLGERESFGAREGMVKRRSSLETPKQGSATERRSSAVPPGAATERLFDRGKLLSREEMQEMRMLFDSFDLDKSGHISAAELSSVLEKLGTPMPLEKVKALIQLHDEDGGGTICFDEFLKVIERCQSTASLSKFAEVIHKQKATVMQLKKGSIVHSFDEEECAAFRDFINTKLSHVPELSYLLPIQELHELFDSVADGVLLCRLINVAVAETIDERAINLAPRNKFHVTENHNLALNAAKSIGLTVVNIGPDDLIEQRPHLILGLIWQMVKMTLLSNINLKECPSLVRMLEPGEELDTLLKLPPEKLLMRWVNYHLAKAGHPKRVTNFGSDLKDSHVYAVLLKEIDGEKKCSTDILNNPDLHERAQYVIAQGRRLGAEFTVQPADIVKGNDKLNLGFVAALFNASPGLEPPAEQELKLMEELPDDDAGDSREERAFRMWINSLGIERHVDNLFDHLRDGVPILQTMDHVQPGVVEWTRVNKQCKDSQVFKKVENLNYAVDLGKAAFSFSLVGVQGKDIVDGSKKLTLALIWQLFRYHLVSFLTKLRSNKGQLGGNGALTDEDIIRWANEKVASAGAGEQVRDLHDKSLSSGVFLIRLLAAVEPRCVDFSHVTSGESEDEKKLNAKYAISAARKLGCSLFLLWEDIVDVRPKMLLSFVASVMAFALSNAAAAR
eukprot:CAMPEP_0119298776 /NCGR_PEP_ID=MMETSP1333-20130426/926_1 /TAXON_ID=418940 /ORGANISM="Scyphosphaera apsteinii, Strain RCC1455" /LENGTH=760 /DNA_ID=CAMNT_0007299969 /DNA_START=35 /DNA_END=2317 /DNA_ORIENTATION=-